MARIAAHPGRLALLTVFLALQAAAGVSAPLHPQESWYVTDGEVRAIVENGGSTYIGGAFRFVGPHTGGGVALKTADGLVDPTWPRIDGEVDVVIGDGAGGWYIGGLIAQVAGLPRSNFAHILPNGQVGLLQPNFDGRVAAMALFGNRLYVGGEFSFVDGNGRTGLALLAVNDTASPVRPWDPGLSGPLEIHALVYEAAFNRVHVGGFFSSGFNVNYAAFDGASGANVTPALQNPDGRVKALALDGPTMYVGGEFTQINSSPHVGIARFPASGGALDAWNPGLDSAVRAMIVQAGGLYIGGDFTAVGVTPRNYIAAVDKFTGVAIPGFDPNADNSVHALLLAGGQLFVGGDFLQVGGFTRSRIAVVNPTTGSPNGLPNPCATGRVHSLAATPSQSRVYAAGAFTGFNCVQQDNLAKLNTSDGSLDAVFFARADGPVNAMQLSVPWLYVGGEFGFLGPNLLPHIGRLNPGSGASDLTWSPNTDFAVRAIEVDPPNNRIFAGGDFTRVNAGALTRLHAAAFSTASGADLGWDPDLDAPVRTLRFVGGSPNKVYLGGNFITANVTPPGGPVGSRHLVSVDDFAGAVLGVFNVDPGTGRVNDLVISADRYLGGMFDTLQGQPRNNAAALDGSGIPTAFDPNVVGAEVFTLEPEGASFMYLGGLFNSVGGTFFRNNIALVDAVSGFVTGWDPNIDGAVKDIHSDPVRVYVGGDFSQEGPGLYRQNLAVYCKLPTPAAPMVTAVGNNRLDLSWPAIPGASYSVFRRYASFPWLRIATNVPVPSYVDTAVEGGVVYDYRVSAFLGCESEPSFVSAGIPNGACNLPPQFDGAVAVEQTAGGTCGAQVFWRDAVQVCGSTYAYAVYRGAPGFMPDASNRLALGAPCCSFTDTAALAPATTYSYIVRVTDIQNSQEEDQNLFERTITLGSCTATQPAPLSVFTARSADGENRLEWVNPGGPYVHTEVRYTVAPAPPPAGPFDGAPVPGGPFGGVPGQKDRAVHGGLTNGDTYQYAGFVFAGGPDPFSSPLQSSGRPATLPAEQRWAYKTTAAALSATAVVPGRTYLPVSNDRMLHAVTAGDVTLPVPGGEWPTAWKPFVMNAPAQNRPTVIQFIGTPPAGLPQRIALVSSQDGRVYCLDADQGTIRWVSPPLGQVLTASPTVMTTNFGGLVDRVFVGTRNSVGDNQLYGLQLGSGAIDGSWIFGNGGGPSGIGIISASAVVDYAANRVYFTSRRKGGPGTGSQDTVWAVNVTAGGFTFAWSRDYGEMDSAASRPQGSSLLMVGNNSGQVRALNTSDGSEYWSSPFVGAGALKGFVFPQGNSSRMFFAAGNRLFGIDNNGAGTVPTLAWQESVVPSPSTPLVSLVSGQYMVYYGGADGCVYQRPSDGSTRIGVRLGSPGSPPKLGQPTLDVTNNRLLLGSDEGRIYVANLIFPAVSDPSCP